MIFLGHYESCVFEIFCLIFFLHKTLDRYRPYHGRSIQNRSIVLSRPSLHLHQTERRETKIKTRTINKVFPLARDAVHKT